MSLDLSSFENDLRAIVIGASGGIGGAMVKALEAHPRVAEVISLSRPEIGITDEKSIARAAESLSGKFDIILLATGFLHNSTTGPEKSLRDISMDNFEQVFRVNTHGPALVAKHFLPLLRRDGKSVFAALSARVGSISDNRIGGWYAYRASKAALNMLLRTAAIETGRRNKQAVIIGLHPGTVDTKLSEPFQSNVPDGKLFTAEYSAEKLLSVVNQVTSKETGLVFAWDGKQIPF